MQLRKVFTSKWLILVLVLAFAVAPSFAQSVSLNVSTDEFITSINQWLPLAIAVVVIGVGISAAFGLAEYIGEMFNKAFRRK